VVAAFVQGATGSESDRAKRNRRGKAIMANNPRDNDQAQKSGERRQEPNMDDANRQPQNDGGRQQEAQQDQKRQQGAPDDKRDQKKPQQQR